ncbi:carbohydrate ABC transporter permease [Breznakiella homolactica]|uniref:Sugar ABC transporter permease n=1 Tax=Breznakiella homolactica TaxID=2798577 RepID=A0A7T7XLI0_9SPIR|nr:sugar ABC transporter permease [Breznakiella homolactica]QQO08398.1 sugar ABC transporter permease [Breznakiella homolactica]
MTQFSPRARNNIIALQFILPALILILLFIIFPILRTVVMSFQEWFLSSGSPDHPFIGFENYIDAVTNPNFPGMISVTLIYTAASVAGKMLLGLGVALLLNRKFFGRSFVRGLMLIPWAMPAVVVCTVFIVSLSPTYGIITHYLVKFGIMKQPFDVFTQKGSALTMVTLIGIWKNFPFISLMLLAALQGISKDLYEAASIDGAGALRQFASVTWPSIRPIWNTTMVLQILWTIKEFELVYLITRGGPDNGTAVIGVDIYLNAFRFYKVGTASAEGMMLLVFCLIFAVIYYRQQQKMER